MLADVLAADQRRVLTAALAMQRQSWEQGVPSVEAQAFLLLASALERGIAR